MSADIDTLGMDSAARAVWHLAIGQSLPTSGPLRAGGWRVLSGALRLDPLRHAPEPTAVAQLALPGDLVGLETLCGQAPMFQARALLPCRLQALAVPMDPGVRAERLGEALGRCWMRSTEMASLRRGPVHARMARLLAALVAAAAGEGGSLPTVPGDTPLRLPRPRPRGRDLAELLDTTPETVSRILSQWRREALSDAAQMSGLPPAPPGSYHHVIARPARPRPVAALRAV